MPEIIRYKVFLPRQSKDMEVFSFVANASEVQRFARIDRIARDEKGRLTGFQRPQIANHIREIRNYLESPKAILPNPIVIAFTDSTIIRKEKDGQGEIQIDVSNGPPGWIVDGQQRISALSEIPERDFEIFISGFICRDEEELHRQFILINNTRPLPKTLIYELLPNIMNLPERMGNRSVSAKLVEMLNYREESSLKRQIRQQTNPYGVISDIAVQNVILNSLGYGALQIIKNGEDFEEKAFELISNYFRAVQNVFQVEWDDHKPNTSRLIHGAGIVGMGWVMDTLCSLMGAWKEEEFEKGLGLLKENTAWTAGTWNFGNGDQRPWNGIQNVPGDVRRLSEYLVRVVQKNYRSASA